jgi:hypothetical protein
MSIMDCVTGPNQVHLGQPLDPATLDALADFICGDQGDKYPTYRSSTYLTQFFQSVRVDVVHDGSTRKWWVLEVLKSLTPSQLEAVALRLTDLREYKADQAKLRLALQSMNRILSMDGLAVGFSGSRPFLKQAQNLALDEVELMKPTPSTDEAEFLRHEFKESLRIDDLGLDAIVTLYLQARVDEIQACPRNKVPLGVIFLLGSTLEGLLLAFALQDQARFISSAAAPKDKSGRVKSLQDWTLNELIDVAHEIGLLDLDVKKFSHVLRGFRNYIHPYEQMAQRFSPDGHTVEICLQVFRAAVAQLRASKG